MRIVVTRRPPGDALDMLDPGCSTRSLDVFDPVGAAQVYVEIVSETPGTLFFAVGGGLVGAGYGARLGRKPQIEPQIELTPT